MTKKEFWIVFLLALVNFTHILDFMIMMPLGNILMPLWKLNTSEFAQVVSAYPLTAFLSSFCAIFYADKFNRKHLLLVAYFGFLIGTFLCSMANGYTSMMAARVLTGLFGGLISSQVLSMIGDYIPYEKRGRAMGVLMSGFALASIIGVPLSLFLANHFGWFLPFWLVAAMGVILFLVLIKVLPDFKFHLVNPVKLKDRVQHFKEIFSNRTQIVALSLGSLLMMGHFLIIPLMNPYMVFNAGVAQKNTPLIYLFGGIASIIASIIAGKLSDKYGKFKVFIFSVFISLPFIFMVANMPQWPLAIILVLFSMWFAAATSRSIPANAMITQSVSANSRGSFMSFNSCVQQLGTGIATQASGWLTSSNADGVITGYANLGYLSILIISCCAYLGWLLNKRLIA